MCWSNDCTTDDTLDPIIERARELAAAAPPLTPEQRRRLRTLLCPDVQQTDDV